MENQRPMRVNRRKNNQTVLFFIVILFLALLAFLIAWIWQAATHTDKPSSVLTSSSSSSLSSSSDTSQSSSESASQSESSSASSQTSTQPGSADSRFADALPAGERVSNSYFDDAVFLGDSITSGISLYSVMSNASVVASTGVNLQTILTDAVLTDSSGNKALAVDAVTSYHPGKIYVMMGANGIEFMDTDTIVSLYGQLIDQLKEKNPDAIIYVQSVLPVTQAFEQARPGLSNAVIDECNVALLEMAKEKGVYYLQVADAFKDDQGRLPDEASPADGMHFGPTYYDKWFEYLRVHTVPQTTDALQ